MEALVQKVFFLKECIDFIRSEDFVVFEDVDCGVLGSDAYLVISI